MGIGAVILNYNDADLTMALAERVASWESVSRVAVVDNASTDESPVRLKALRDIPKVTLIFSPVNGGYGRGNNMGIKYLREETECDYALVINPDVSLDEELIGRLLAAFSPDTGVALSGAVISEKKSGFSYKEYLLSGWKERGFLGELIYSGPILKRLFRGLINYPYSYYNDREEYVPVYALHGSLLLIDIEKFLSAGGFDEEFFLYGEEYALGARLKSAGFSSCLVKASYTHYGSHSISGAGLDALARQRLRLNSELIYYRKYLHAGAFKLLIAGIMGKIVLLETRILNGRK